MIGSAMIFYMPARERSVKIKNTQEIFFQEILVGFDEELIENCINHVGFFQSQPKLSLRTIVENCCFCMYAL